MKVKISLSNSKLGYQIPSVNLLPSLSCRADAPCAKGCYGRKGNFIYSKVQEAHKANYEYYKEDSKSFFKDIQNFLNDSLVSYKYFRWHGVGDIVDDEYLKGMIQTAEKCPQVKFLCFTKQFEIVNSYIDKSGAIPKNLKIVFSYWHKGFKVNNPYNLPSAYVFFRKSSLNPEIPELSIPCTGKCYECQACRSLEKGQSVVFNQH